MSYLTELIEQSHGHFITVRFIKKDGSIRRMRCRLGVKRYLKGGKSTLNPAQYLTVFDVEKMDYRAINRAQVLSVTCKRTTWLNIKENNV